MQGIRFKKRNAVIGAGIYIFAAGIVSVFTTQFSQIIWIVLALYCMTCVVVVRLMISRARATEDSTVVSFKRYRGLERYGDEWSSFFHVFRCKDSLALKIADAIGKRINSDLATSQLQPVRVRDTDSDLREPEERTFLCTTGITTSRGATVTFAMFPTSIGSLQGIRWWVLARGIEDPNKSFWRQLLSPVLLWFVLIPYLQGKLDPLSWTRSTDFGFYNGLDMLAFARKLEHVALYTLIEILDEHGVDTSDLKAQVGSVLNINVSGGNAKIGNVVQGAFNRIGGQSQKGAKAS